MRKIKRYLPFILAGFLLVQLVTYIGLYRDYSEYTAAYKHSRDAMLTVYIERGDASELQSQTSHLKATAEMRLNAMNNFLWETVYVMAPIVILYAFTFILSLLPEREEKPKPKQNTDLDDPYMEKGDGDILYDERTGVH